MNSPFNFHWYRSLKGFAHSIVFKHNTWDVRQITLCNLLGHTGIKERKQERERDTERENKMQNHALQLLASCKTGTKKIAKILTTKGSMTYLFTYKYFESQNREELE